MIDLKIIMINGQEYAIRNFAVDTLRNFVHVVLYPQKTQILWYEVIPGVLIQTSQIQSISEIDSDEISYLHASTSFRKGEVIFPEDMDNQEIENKAESENNIQ